MSEYVTESVETLAEMLYRATEWSGCAGSGWGRLTPGQRQRHYDNAAALLASGVVRPAAEVRAEAWPEGYRAAMTASIGMQGRPNQGASFPADWPDHNPHRAALAEEGGDGG